MALGMLEEDEKLRDLPCLIVAIMLHGALLSVPLLTGGPAKSVLQDSVAVDFVASVPVTPPPPPPVTIASPALAPVPAGGEREGVPHKGEGDFKPEEKIKPKTKHVAPVAQKGKKAPAHVKRAPLVIAKKKPAGPTPEQLAAAARRKAEVAAIRAENERIREEKLKAARLAAAEVAEKRAAEARAREEERVRVAQEKARFEQERKAAVARRKADAAQALAMIADPDEKLSDAVADRPAEGPLAGSPRGHGKMEGAVPSASIQAAKLRDGEEAVYELEAEGRGSKNVKASGGGKGVDGGGLSWSLEGPAGSRRLLKRALPTSPEWLSQRGLELSVQVKFQVLPDGTVKPGAAIKKTSGFPEIDSRALDALKKWKFDPAAAKTGAPETWGVVTFRFQLS